MMTSIASAFRCRSSGSGEPRHVLGDHLAVRQGQAPAGTRVREPPDLTQGLAGGSQNAHPKLGQRGNRDPALTGGGGGRSSRDLVPRPRRWTRLHPDAQMRRYCCLPAGRPGSRRPRTLPPCHRPDARGPRTGSRTGARPALGRPAHERLRFLPRPREGASATRCSWPSARGGRSSKTGTTSHDRCSSGWNVTCGGRRPMSVSPSCTRSSRARRAGAPAHDRPGALSALPFRRPGGSDGDDRGGVQAHRRRHAGRGARRADLPRSGGAGAVTC
jgi:hypothetical protein